jgi:uncharacterized protein (TIGR00297 family)
MLLTVIPMPELLSPWVVAIALNSILIAIAAIAPKKVLTPEGLLHAWVLGVVLWGTLGWKGYLVMVAYFAIGSGITFVGKAQKEAMGIAEKRGGARGPENVWGSALVATFCALGVYFTGLDGSSPKTAAALLVLAYVASIATKLSDTCATEVGKAYGKRTFLITTLQPVPRGTEGAVSLEGTIAGVIGSAVLAVLAAVIGLITPLGVVQCISAAFIATTMESLIGATIEGKVPGLTHDVVNVINTLIGAIAAVLLTAII